MNMTYDQRTLCRVHEGRCKVKLYNVERGFISQDMNTYVPDIDDAMVFATLSDIFDVMDHPDYKDFILIEYYGE